MIEFFLDVYLIGFALVTIWRGLKTFDFIEALIYGTFWPLVFAAAVVTAIEDA